MMDPDLSPFANHIWQSTLCGFAAWLLSLVLRNNRAAVRYGLWMAASVKFLIPFSLLARIGSHLGSRGARVISPRPYRVLINAISRPFASYSPRTPLPDTQAAHHPFPGMLLAAIWLCGFTIALIFWIRWWQAMRAARGAGTPLDLGLPIPAVSTPARLEPGVFGIWKPVLLLPEGIRERLTAAQLDAVVAHELCHVRRRDNLTAAIHMLVETIFWFHPLVWWIRARLLEERERACDQNVLKLISDPRIYAEGVLNVCKFYVESPLACAAGVTGANLKGRIEEIIANSTLRDLDPARKLLLGSAALALLGVPVGMGILHPAPLRAQSESGQHLAFAVASIKQDKSGNPRTGGVTPSLQLLPGGKFVARNIPLAMIVAVAYNLPPFQSNRLSGGPEWLWEDRYDIEAAAEDGMVPAGTSVKIRDEKIHLMIQTLLADRFKMNLRRQVQEVPVYAVVVRKGGPKLERSATDEKDCANSPTGLGGADSCHGFDGGMGRGLHATAVTIADIALAVSNWADRPVVDKTGLEGLYKVETDGWAPLRPRPRSPGREPTAEDIAMADPGRPTLFQIFERMGLKLDSEKAPVETFVIESVARPTEN